LNHGTGEKYPPPVENPTADFGERHCPILSFASGKFKENFSCGTKTERLDIPSLLPLSFWSRMNQKVRNTVAVDKGLLWLG
jgi:hypothetical protein